MKILGRMPGLEYPRSQGKASVLQRGFVWRKMLDSDQGLKHGDKGLDKGLD